MVVALKSRCVPVLRDRGFKGSFPRFFRETDGFVALVGFQFFSSGGSFCVNLGYADPDRMNVPVRPGTEAKELKVEQTIDRARLGATAGGDHWFSFGPTSYGEFRGAPSPADEVAATCGRLLVSEAETWWDSKRRKTQAGLCGLRPPERLWAGIPRVRCRTRRCAERRRRS